MRTTVALLLTAAFVATMPSLASAKSKRHYRRAAPVVTVVDSNEAGPRLVGNALRQLIVPLEVTFAPQPEYVDPPVRHRRHRVRRPS